MSSHSDDYLRALQLLRERGNYDRGYITNPRSGSVGPELGLVRTRALLDELGSPDRAYPIVHVAGSKGKGSTSAFVAGIGKAAGYRTGLSTSPHLHTFRERIAIDGVPVDEPVFATLAFETEAAVAQLERQRPELGEVTAFELLTVMALLAFAEQSCQLAVIEVGLGGTYDSTNVIAPAVSIITRLDLEHTQILGDTIESIAANKAGIVKPGIPSITASQEPAALSVIENTAARRGAPLMIAGRDFDTTGTWQDFSWTGPNRPLDHLRTGMAGPHQMENASLAIAAWGCLIGQGLTASNEAIHTGLATAALPGRFERVSAGGRTWILDGAHTPLAAAALAIEVLDELGSPIPAIVGLLSDKHPAPFLEALAPCVSGLILTEPRNPRAFPANELVPIAHAAISQVTASRDLETSLHEARARTGAATPVLITGSLVLVGEARELLGLAVADPVTSEAQIPANLRSITIG
ncbi:MAG TPA: folylpolyglutamate synthase/dihydrofolate synthase family protein [Thermomicrobiales bacterium]|nr:folylpolyglutamate synthase/dihydrofolate synthase family protein [Thermomicrobiales bacterium]